MSARIVFLSLVLSVAACVGSADRNPTNESVPCASAGGACGAPHECNVGDGVLGGSSYNCGGSRLVCCLPTCGGQRESFECCNGNHTYAPRPLCKQGVLSCEPGFSSVAIGTCLRN
jgi:hypothetical protein